MERKSGPPAAGHKRDETRFSPHRPTDTTAWCGARRDDRKWGLSVKADKL
jgi:hypothetical protein